VEKLMTDVIGPLLPSQSQRGAEKKPPKRSLKPDPKNNIWKTSGVIYIYMDSRWFIFNTGLLKSCHNVSRLKAACSIYFGIVIILVVDPLETHQTIHAIHHHHGQT